MWNQEKAKATQFKTDRPESCTAQISVRVPPSMKEELKELKGWQEIVRKSLEDAIAKKAVKAKSAA